MFRAVILLIVLVSFVFANIDVLVMDYSGLEPVCFREILVDGVDSVDYENDETFLNFPLLFSEYQVLVISGNPDGPGVIPGDVVINVEAFSRAGGRVLVAVNGDVLQNSFIRSLIGTEGYTDCEFSQYLYPLTPFSSDAACFDLTTGFKDISGLLPDYTNYATVLDYDADRGCVETGAPLEAISCLGRDYGVEGSSFITIRPMDEGSISYITRGFDSSTTFIGFLSTAYNNLLVSAGAFPFDTSSFLGASVLHLVDGDDDYSYYYLPVIENAAISGATFTRGTYDLFLEDCNLSGFNMVIAYGYGGYTRTVEGMACLETFASGGGTVLNAGPDDWDASGTDGEDYNFIGVENTGDSLYDCSSFYYESYSINPFPADYDCEPMLNGGFSDLTGLDPEIDFPDQIYRMRDLDCAYLSDLTTSTACLVTDSLDEDSAIWLARRYPSGGVMAFIGSGFYTSQAVFAADFYRIALNNLIVWSSSNFCAERECRPYDPAFLIQPTDSLSVYNPACITWIVSEIPADPIPMFYFENTNGDRQVIATDIPNTGYFYWPFVFGISPGNVIISAFIDDELSQVSEIFTLFNPTVEQDPVGECVSPCDQICTGRGEMCMDDGEGGFECSCGACGATCDGFCEIGEECLGSSPNFFCGLLIEEF